MEEGDAQRLADAAELDRHALAQVGVEGAQRLVEQADAGFGDQGAGEGDSLLLAAGELAGHAGLEPGQAHEVEGGAGAAVDFLRVRDGGGLAEAQAEGDVVEDRHVGEERVVLLDDAEPPAVGRQGRDVPPVEQHAAGVGTLEPRDHAQQRGLARAGGAQQRQVLVVPDDEGDVVEGDLGPVAPGEALELQHVGVSSVVRLAGSELHFDDKSQNCLPIWRRIPRKRWRIEQGRPDMRRLESVFRIRKPIISVTFAATTRGQA